jgi:hypothetical protein
MTSLDKLKTVLKIPKTDASNDEILSVYLEDAAEEIINRVYPYRRNEVVCRVPSRYANKQIKIAAWFFNKIGAEGQIKHDENGIKREWESANIPDSLVNDITPFVGTVRGAEEKPDDHEIFLTVSGSSFNTSDENEFRVKSAS